LTVAQRPLPGISALLEFSRRKARPAAAPTAIPAAPPPAPDSSSVAESPISEWRDDRAAPLAEHEERPFTPGPVEPLRTDSAATGMQADQASAVERISPPIVDQVPPPAPTKPPARIGLGLRRTRENFLIRIRAAITGSAKLDDIYEGLEEALISADVGLETSLKIIQQVRAQLKNDARPEIIRDALKGEIERILLAVERPFTDSGDAPL